MIKAIKTGLVGLHPAWGPDVELIEGAKISLAAMKKVCTGYRTEPKVAMERLVEIGWAEWIEPIPGQEENDEINTDEIIDDVEKIIRGKIVGKNEAEQKQIIQDYGVLHFGYKIAKTKKVDTMIAELIEYSSAIEEDDEDIEDSDSE